MAEYPTTPDGRYFVVRGQLWRSSDPRLGETERAELVGRLMAARRAVKHAKSANDAGALKVARADVQRTKVALGERGPTWWDDQTDYNRQQIENTPYGPWWTDLSKKMAVSYDWHS